MVGSNDCLISSQLNTEQMVADNGKIQILLRSGNKIIKNID